ncbi:MAG: hypothetical protein WBP64_01500 [Nitrososphaeraceae archaeon]
MFRERPYGIFGSSSFIELRLVVSSIRIARSGGNSEHEHARPSIHVIFAF